MVIDLRGEVEHVDENQAEGDKEDDPGGDNVGGDEERNLNKLSIFSNFLCEMFK